MASMLEQGLDLAAGHGRAPGSLAVRDVGVGHPVVFLHGQSGDSGIWAPAEAALAGDGLRTLAVDRPGYGATSLDPGGFSHNADALVAFLASATDRPAVVVAHSWAAGPAILAARRAPELVSGLVLCAPVGDRRSVTALDRVLARSRPGRAVLRTALAVGGWLVHLPFGERLLPAGGLGRLTAAEARSATSPVLDRRVRHAAGVEQLALVEELPEVRRAARRLTVPTVVVAGTHDGVVTLSAARGLARAVPGARLVTLDAGHLLPLEQPAAVVDAVRSLTGTTGTTGTAGPAGGGTAAEPVVTTDADGRTVIDLRHA